MFAFLLLELDLLEYTYIFHMHFQHQKQLLINARMNYIACQYNYIMCYKSCVSEHHKKSHYALQW